MVRSQCTQIYVSKYFLKGIFTKKFESENIRIRSFKENISFTVITYFCDVWWYFFFGVTGGGFLLYSWELVWIWRDLVSFVIVFTSIDFSAPPVVCAEMFGELEHASWSSVWKENHSVLVLETNSWCNNYFIKILLNQINSFSLRLIPETIYLITAKIIKIIMEGMLERQLGLIIANPLG